MTTPAEAAAARRARLVLLVFALFVVYGSFFPFSFRVDPTEVQRDLVRFWGTLTLFDGRGRRLFSIADLVSNVLLGLPVGLLLVPSRLLGQGLTTRLLGVLAAEIVFAGAVEVGQILAPTRTASALDVLAQVGGALLGALLAHGRGVTAFRAGEARGAAIVRARPALIVVGVLGALLAADALYPFALTLDVSTAWGNLKRAQWMPLASFGRRLWSDLLVERVVPYAGLAVVSRSSADYQLVRGRPVRRRRAPMTRGLNRNHNRVLKNVFKSAATAATARPGALQTFYQTRVASGMREDLARVTLTRKLAALTLRLWKTGAPYDPAQLTTAAP